MSQEKLSALSTMPIKSEEICSLSSEDIINDFAIKKSPNMYFLIFQLICYANML